VTTGNELVSFEDDRFDAAVRFGIGNWPELHCQKIWDVEIGLVCGKRYIEETSIQGNLPFTKEALSRHTLISLDEDLGDWQSIFPDIEPRDRIVCDSYFAAVRSAEEGLGIAVGLQPVINSWINSGRLVSICNPVHSQTRAYWLVAKQGQSESAAHKEVYSWLRDLFADLANKS
jgi:LysR family glycine cleavage system transcriptional activator